MEQHSIEDLIPDGGVQLCELASSLRDFTPCRLGSHRTGGFNVIFDIMFEDQVLWLARIPLPNNCHQPEEITLSYAATLKYLKIHTKIPVPRVYDYAVKSNPKNATGVSYILMEHLGGQVLPELLPGPDSSYFEPNAHELALAKKVHQQLTDVIIELASLKFDKIGSLREDSDGGFSVVAFADSATGSSKARASAYNKLAKSKQGPFSSIPEFYDAMSDLNDLNVNEDPESEDEEEEETDRENRVLQNKQLREMAPHFIIDAFCNGPFVIHHDDLTTGNILVDVDFNITGILDFPGTVVPLPSLCVYPWIFSDNTAGFISDRDIYLDVFLNREALCASSALASKSVREELMKAANERHDFELGLLRIYGPLVVPYLLEYVYGENDTNDKKDDLNDGEDDSNDEDDDSNDEDDDSNDEEDDSNDEEDDSNDGENDSNDGEDDLHDGEDDTNNEKGTKDGEDETNNKKDTKDGEDDTNNKKNTKNGGR